MSILVETHATFEVATPRARPAVFSRTGSRASTAVMHPIVFRIAASAYAAMILTFWIAFTGPGEVTLELAIDTLVFAAFFGLPWIMERDAAKFLARHGRPPQPVGTFRSFLASEFETSDGHLTGFEAMVLVITVPVCLFGAAFAFALIYNGLA